MKINSIKLKSRREHLGLSQKKLAEKSNIGIATIQRLEKDDNAESTRGHTIKQLASALEMAKEDLCSAASPEEPKRAEKLRGPKYMRKINATNDFVCRSDLLARRYNLSRIDIMNMMRIAFLLFAEEIQRKRRDRLKELNAALKTAGGSNHYLAFTESMRADDFLGLEYRSILNNELFAESFQEDEEHWFDPYNGNPVSDHILEKIDQVFSDLDETKSAEIIHIWSKDGPNNLPDDDFLDAELKKVTHGNALCKTALRVGELTIDEIPDNAGEKPEEFQAWLEQKAPYSFEQEKQLSEIFADLEI